MSDTTVSIPGATAQDPVAEGMQQNSAAGMDVPSSERDPPVPVVTTGSGVTVSNSSRKVAQLPRKGLVLARSALRSGRWEGDGAQRKGSLQMLI